MNKEDKIKSNVVDRKVLSFKQLDKKHPLAGYQMKEWYLDDKSAFITSGMVGVLVDVNCLDIRSVEEMKHLIETLSKAWWWHEHLVEKNRQ